MNDIIKPNAWYIAAQQSHRGEPTADRDTGSGWLSRFWKWTGWVDNDSHDFIPNEDEDATLETLSAWMDDDQQSSIFAEVPFDKPSTREDADAILTQVVGHHVALAGVVEHELVRMWRWHGDRETTTFDALYGPEYA